MNNSTINLLSKSLSHSFTFCVFLLVPFAISSCGGKKETDSEFVTKENVTSHLTESFEGYSKKDYKSSIEESSKVIEFNPDSPEAYFNRGMSKHKSNDRGGALKDLKKAQQLYRSQGNKVGFQLVSRAIEKISAEKKKGLFR